MKHLLSAIAALALAATLAGTAGASSHREAPFLPRRADPRPAAAPQASAPAQVTAAPTPAPSPSATSPMFALSGVYPFLSPLMFAWADDVWFSALRGR